MRSRKAALFKQPFCISGTFSYSNVLERLIQFLLSYYINEKKILCCVCYLLVDLEEIRALLLGKSGYKYFYY